MALTYLLPRKRLASVNGIVLPYVDEALALEFAYVHASHTPRVQLRLAVSLIPRFLRSRFTHRHILLTLVILSDLGY